MKQIVPNGTVDKAQFKRMLDARMTLIMDKPWFGTQALNLDVVEKVRAKPEHQKVAAKLAIAESFDVDTMATDGSTLWFNPEFVATLSDAEVVAVIAHEVMHCVLLHPFRRGHRDREQWNIACDYAVNSLLVKAGFKLPKDCLLDPKYDGLSAEVIYAKRQHEGNPTPNGKVIGDVVDAKPEPQQGPGQPATGNTETDWKIFAEQASAVAKMAGELPGDAATAAKQAQHKPADWVALTREFVEHVIPSDYSWTTPNRRFIASGLYLPGVFKENLGPIVIVRDTSGSISQSVIGAWNREIVPIVKDCKPESIVVIDCDARVKQVQKFTVDDFTMTPLETAKGGGGTLFNPAFTYIRENLDEPAAVIFFTDLENSDGKLADPGYPVLWVTGKNVTRKQPFGQLAVIDVNV